MEGIFLLEACSNLWKGVWAHGLVILGDMRIRIRYSGT